jgi:hypothetical protein
MSTTLEQRIATALADDATSSTLSALIEEIEAVATAADAEAEQARVRVLDPTVIDAHKARIALEAATFRRDRLQAALSALVQRLQEVQAAEYAARWKSEYERVEAERDELARKYAEYPKLVARLVDLFESAKAVDEKVSRINRSGPPGEHRRLLGVSLPRTVLKASKGVQLPDWARSARIAWRPPRPFDPASFAPVPFDRRLSAEWGKVQEEGRAMRE